MLHRPTASSSRRLFRFLTALAISFSLFPSAFVSDAEAGIATTGKLVASPSTTGASNASYTATYVAQNTGPVTKLFWKSLRRLDTESSSSHGVWGTSCVPTLTTSCSLTVTGLTGLGGVSASAASAVLQDNACTFSTFLNFTGTCRQVVITLPSGASTVRAAEVTATVSGFTNPTSSTLRSVTLETWDRTQLVDRIRVGLTIGSPTLPGTTNPPTLDSVTVDRGNLTLDFNESYDPCCGLPGFSVSVNGADDPVRDFTRGSSDDLATIRLERPVLPGNTVTVSYAQPTIGVSGYPLTDSGSTTSVPPDQDATLDKLASFSGRAVTNVTPSTAGAISGTVKDAASGAAIPHASVGFSPVAGGAGGSTVADNLGVYTVVVPNPGAYRGSASRNTEAYPTTPTTDDVTVETGQTTTGVDFSLTKGFIVTGTVTDVDPSTNLPTAGIPDSGRLSDVSVEARPASGIGSAFSTSTSGSDSIHGQYTLALPLGVSYNLFISGLNASYPRTQSANPVNANRDTTAGQVITANFQLSKGWVISGTVTKDGGTALTNTRVRLVDHSNPSNEIASFFLSEFPCCDLLDGEFRLVVPKNLQTTYDLVIQADGYFRTVVPINSTQLLADTPVSGTCITNAKINLNCLNARTISGSVSGPASGTYSLFTRVRAFPASKSSPFAQTAGLVVAGAPGNYTGTSYALRVPNGQYDVRVDGVVGFVAPPKVTTAALTSDLTGLNFSYAAGYVVSGSVAQGGTGVAGATLRVVDHGNPTGPAVASSSTCNSTTCGVGTFKITVPQGLPNSLDLVVNFKGYYPVIKALNNGNALTGDPAVVTIAAGTIDLNTENPNTISGSVSLPTGQDPQPTFVRTWRSIDNNRNPQAVTGQLTVTSTTPATYGLRVPNGDFAVGVDARFGLIPSPRTATVSCPGTSCPAGSVGSGTNNFTYAIGRKISGLVTSDGTDPAEGASLIIVDHSDPTGPAIAQASTTRTSIDSAGNTVQAGGRILLTVPLDAPALDLVVVGENFFPVTKYLGVVSADLVDANALNISLSASNPNLLKGTITGLPTGALTGVSAWRPTDPSGQLFRAFDNGIGNGGTFTLHLPDGEWRVRPYDQANLVTPATQNVRLSSGSQTATADFTYASGNSISGTVLGLSGNAPGNPLGNALVRVRSTDPSINYDAATRRSKANGTYSVTVPAGRYYVLLQLEGNNSERLDGYYSLPPNGTPMVEATGVPPTPYSADFTLLGRSFSTISGTVSCKAGSSACQAAAGFDPTQIRATVSRSGGGASGQYGNGVPSPTGAYTLTVPRGQASWYVSAYQKPGFILTGMGTVAISDAVTSATVDLTYNLADKTLTGTVTRKVASGTGPAVPGARINANRAGGGFAAAVSGDDGAYKLALIPGTWNITVAPDMSVASTADWIFGQSALQVTIADTDTTKTLPITVFTATATVTGSIVKPASLGGGPATGSVGLWNGPLGNKSLLDKDGGFSIRLPVGTYTMTRPADPDTSLPLPAPKVTVNDGQTLSLPPITLAAKLLTVLGQVRNASAAGSPGIPEIVVGGSSPVGDGGSVVTDSSGNYTLKLVPAASSGETISWRVSPRLPLDGRFVNATGALVVQQGGTSTGKNFDLLVADATIRVTLKHDSTSFLAGQLTTGSVSVRGKSPTEGAPGITVSRTIKDASQLIDVPVPAGASQTQGWTWTAVVSVPPDTGYLAPPPQAVTPVVGTTPTSVTMTLVDTDAQITGFLRTAQGEAIKDVRANVVATGTSSAVLGATARGQVDPSTGTYSLKARGGESWKVTISIDPVAYPNVLIRPDTRVQTVSASQLSAGGTATVDFVGLQANASITGKLMTDASNAGIAGAHVRVFQPPDTTGANAKPLVFINGVLTDKDGNYTVKVPAGPWLVRTFFEGLLPQANVSITLAPGDAKPQDFKFRTSNAQIMGKVTLNGAGVPALVRGLSLGGVASSVRASSDGTYVLRVLNGDSWKVEAVYENTAASTFYTSSRELVTLSSSANEAAGIDLALGSTGQMLPGARSEVFPAAEAKTIRLENEVTISFAPGALAVEGDVTVTVTPTGDVSGTGPVRPLSFAYDITAFESDGDPITVLRQPVTIVIPYTDEQLALAGISDPAQQITAGFLNVSGAIQASATVTVDVVNKRVIIQEDHLSPFLLASLLPPLRALINPVSSGATSAETLVISGSSEPGSTVRMWVGTADGQKDPAQMLLATSALGTGLSAYSLTATLVTGAASLVVTATDANGAESLPTRVTEQSPGAAAPAPASGGGGGAGAPAATQPTAPTEVQPVAQPILPAPIISQAQPPVEAAPTAPPPAPTIVAPEVAQQVSSALESLGVTPNDDPIAVVQALIESGPAEVADALRALSPEDQLTLVQQLLNPLAEAPVASPEASAPEAAPPGAESAPEAGPGEPSGSESLSPFE